LRNSLFTGKQKGVALNDLHVNPQQFDGTAIYTRTSGPAVSAEISLSVAAASSMTTTAEAAVSSTTAEIQCTQIQHKI
jgi:hypothetical protein